MLGLLNGSSGFENLLIKPVRWTGFLNCFSELVSELVLFELFQLVGLFVGIVFFHRTIGVKVPFGANRPLEKNHFSNRLFK